MKVVWLRCACCGESAPAYKQWWNQDTGYGCCARCFNAYVARYGDKGWEEDAERIYGKPGVHHSLPEWQDTDDERDSALTAGERNK